MGQRHQVFIVARISSPDGTSKYRGVGAFHHQWCYGTLPLAALRRFLTLIRQPDNERIILDELTRVHAVSPKIEVPCPYSLFLLGSAWNVNLHPANPCSPRTGFLNSCLPAAMGSFSGDNNDGITVIDITIPAKATYAFLQDWAAILTAEEYVRGYHGAPGSDSDGDASFNDGEGSDAGMEECVLDAIAALDGEQLMPMETLAAVWPREYRAPKPKEVTSANVVPTVDAYVLPALADLAIKPAVNQSLGTGSTEALEELLWTLPGKLPLIKDSLRALQPFPEAGISLLSKIILQELGSSQKIDLHYPGLTSAQIVDVLSKIRESAVDMSVVDLSHLSAVTVDVVRSLLCSIPELRRLVLLDTAVTSAQLKELLQSEPNLFKTLEALIHPVFFNVLDPVTHAGGFSLISRTDGRQINSAYVAIWTPEHIIQSLIDLLLATVTDGPDAFSYSYSGSMAMQCALSAIRMEGTPWSERSVSCVGVTSLSILGRGYAGWSFMIVPIDYSPGTKCTIYDLDGFLKEAANEGRAIPPAALVKQLHDILESLYFSGPAFLQKLYANDSTLERIPTPSISEILITRKNLEGFTDAAMMSHSLLLYGHIPTIATVP